MRLGDAATVGVLEPDRAVVRALRPGLTLLRPAERGHLKGGSFQGWVGLSLVWFGLVWVGVVGWGWIGLGRAQLVETGGSCGDDDEK